MHEFAFISNVFRVLGRMPVKSRSTNAYVPMAVKCSARCEKEPIARLEQSFQSKHSLPLDSRADPVSDLGRRGSSVPRRSFSPRPRFLPQTLYSIECAT